jgi:hypothetical protein
MSRQIGSLVWSGMRRGSVRGIFALLIGFSGCRERPDAALLRVDKLVPGTLGIPACDSTASAPASWPRFAFASGEFEISLPPGAVVNPELGDRWIAPGQVWVGAFVISDALDRTTTRASQLRDSRREREWCVARTGLGASTAEVWEGDWHPAGVRVWGTALWYLPDARELEVRIQAPVGSDPAIHRTILASVRRIPRTP